MMMRVVVVHGQPNAAFGALRPRYLHQANAVRWHRVCVRVWRRCGAGCGTAAAVGAGVRVAAGDVGGGGGAVAAAVGLRVLHGSA